jgi:hypothetical protein
LEREKYLPLTGNRTVDSKFPVYSLVIILIGLHWLLIET